MGRSDSDFVKRVRSAATLKLKHRNVNVAQLDSDEQLLRRRFFATVVRKKKFVGDIQNAKFIAPDACCGSVAF